MLKKNFDIQNGICLRFLACHQFQKSLYLRCGRIMAVLPLIVRQASSPATMSTGCCLPAGVIRRQSLLNSCFPASTRLVNSCQISKRQSQVWCKILHCCVESSLVCGQDILVLRQIKHVATRGDRPSAESCGGHVYSW